jgi:hypothetical protein
VKKVVSFSCLAAFMSMQDLDDSACLYEALAEYVLIPNKITAF